MPLMDENIIRQATTSGAPEIPVPVDPEEQEAADTPTFSETAFASFTDINVISNAARKAGEVAVHGLDTSASDPNFSFSDHIDGYEDNADQFVGTNSIKDVNRIKFNIDYLNEQKAVIEKSPMWASVVSSIAAGTLDPLVAVPLYKTAQIAGRGARAIQATGSGLAINTGVGAIREASLHGLQETRTLEESIYNAAAEGLFGGILGGAVAAMQNPIKIAGKGILSKAMKGEEFQVTATEGGIPKVERSAGAAEVKGSTLEDEGLAYINETLAKGVSGLGIEQLQSPIIRGLTSQSVDARRLTNKFFIKNNIIGKETQGEAIGDTAELLMRRDSAKLVQLNNVVDKLYLQHAGIGKVKSFITDPRGTNVRAFQDRVAKVMRNEGLQDASPQVNQAGALYREHINKLAKDMLELDILDPSITPKQMANYLTRMYDTQKLLQPATKTRFIDKTSRWFRTKNPDGTLRSGNLDRITKANLEISILKKAGKTIDPRLKAESELDPRAALDEDDALEAAGDTYNNIMGEGDNAFASNSLVEQMISKGRFTKQRALLMPDSELEEFLVNDAQHLVTNYSATSSSLIQTTKALKELGYDSISEMKFAMKVDKDKLLQGATSDKGRLKIQENFLKDIKLVDDIYRVMTNSLVKPGSADRFFDTLMKLNFTRLLGGVSLSSMPELAMAPYRLGLLNTLRDGYLPMVRSFKTAKLAKDQFKDLDIGLELESSNYLKILSGEGEHIGRRKNEFDRMMDVLTDVQSKASGLAYITAGGRRLASHVSSANIIRTLRKFRADGGLPDKEITRLATMGISKGDYDRVLAQIDKHVQEVRGSFISNIHLWDDEVAFNAFSRGVQNTTESIILKPSRGDIPLIFQSTALGKVIFQFKSFTASATNRIAISSIQQRDMKTLTGLMMLTAMGSLSGVVKDRVAGRKTSDSPEEWVADGVSRSGILGLMGSTMLDIAHVASNGKSRRYTGNTVVGQALGPSAGLLQQLGDITAKLADGEISQRDVQAMLRMLPFNNLFYIQALTNKALGDKK